MTKRPAIFLDRDGTINEEVGYVDHPDRFKIMPGSAEAIREINNSPYLAVVVTNQSGVARGFFPESTVEEVHRKMLHTLGAAGASLDGIFYCPHHPTEGSPPYLKTCECRKPKAGMVLRAVEECGIDLCRSFVVGDSLADLEMAENLGIPSILVLTGFGPEVLDKIKEGSAAEPAYVAENLSGAVAWILRNKG